MKMGTAITAYPDASWTVVQIVKTLRSEQLHCHTVPEEWTPLLLDLKRPCTPATFSCFLPTLIVTSAALGVPRGVCLSGPLA